MSYKIHYFLSASIVFLFLITITVQAGGGGGGGGTPPPPPPPPPPCGYQTPGCYVQDGNKLENPTTPENFSFYLAQNACIGGGCTCSLEGFVSDLKQTDPDNSGGACACISGTSWTDNIGCCGDDATDCGLIAEETRFGQVTEKYLCSMDQNFIGSWLPAEPNKGLINYVACSNKELLSDGNNWTECSSFGIIRIDDRDYLCTGELGNQSWIECCGSGSCKSDSSRADTATTGQSRILENTTYYCASDKTIVTDLDIKDRETCNNAKNPNGTNAGFRWTGTLCCSENDDLGEYYNDPGGIGGCWDKEAVLTGDTAPQREDVANIDGIFYGCSIDVSALFPAINQSLLDIKDYHTQQPLIQNKQHCYQDPSKFYFCSFNNTWKLADGQDRSRLSTAPGSFQNVQQPSECCSTTSCWNGSLCLANQADNPASQPINGYRCIDGDWQPAQLRLTPDGRGSGYCQEQSQCLVDTSPNADSRCIQNTEFIDGTDDYCEDGDWTSRTKFVALQLIDISKTSNFVVFCDTPENTLNNLNYLVQGQLVGNFVTTENTNNFCTLIFNGKVLIGTSLNKPVANLTPLLNIIGVSNCNAALINDGQYHACSGTNKVWYNQKLNSIIYSDQSFTIGTTNFLGTFINFIKDPFDTIKNRIMATIQEPFDTSYLDSLKRFNKLYISKSGGKEIRGTVEGRGLNNLVMEYKNFNTDICRFIDEFNEKNEDAGSGIECSKDGSTYYVLAQGNQFTKINPDAIWNDFTSKLRIS